VVAFLPLLALREKKKKRGKKGGKEGGKAANAPPKGFVPGSFRIGNKERKKKGGNGKEKRRPNWPTSSLGKGEKKEGRKEENIHHYLLSLQLIQGKAKEKKRKEKLCWERRIKFYPTLL